MMVKLFVEKNYGGKEKLLQLLEENGEFELLSPTEDGAEVLALVGVSTIKEPKTEAGTAMRSGIISIGRKKLDNRISNILFTIGITAHIKGFTYLREAIRIAISDQKIVNQITKRLYPEIAERHATSPRKVERAIRHAIQVGWDRGRLEKVNEIFGLRAIDSRDKPTNGEFISLLAERLIIESMED